MAPSQRPKGYLGQGHETIGTDIAAVMQILPAPEQVLGADVARRLGEVKADGWYPIGTLLELVEILDEKMGHFGLVRLGRTIFKQAHEEQAKARLKSAKQLVDALDGLYRHNNRGRDIGGWKVLQFKPGYCELEKTTPHHCVMEQGILAAAFSAVGCPVAVSQKRCFRKGAETCIYAITSSVTGRAWGA
jgi:hypothetical protein